MNLNKKTENINLYDVIKDDVLDMKDYDYLMIFYPIYAFNAPKPIIDYVKKIKKIDENKKCLVMKNSGEHLFWNNGSSLYLRSILKGRNISLVSEYHYLMPYSFIFRHYITINSIYIFIKKTTISCF